MMAAPLEGPGEIGGGRLVPAEARYEYLPKTKAGAAHLARQVDFLVRNRGGEAGSPRAEKPRTKRAWEDIGAADIDVAVALQQVRQTDGWCALDAEIRSVKVATVRSVDPESRRLGDERIARIVALIPTLADRGRGIRRAAEDAALIPPEPTPVAGPDEDGDGVKPK